MKKKVGGYNHLEKYESHPIYEMENKKCLKPPAHNMGIRWGKSDI
jgi:hypothetical protein